MTNNWTEADIAALEKNSDVEVDWQSQQETRSARIDDTWTQTEIDFAHEYLEPRLEAGTSLAWWPQPKFRLPFMTYTPDFAEITAVGRLQFYEVKGKYRLGSAGRSSLAVRAFKYFACRPNMWAYRMTRTEDDDWKIVEVLNKRENGPHTRVKPTPPVEI